MTRRPALWTFAGRAGLCFALACGSSTAPPDRRPDPDPDPFPGFPVPLTESAGLYGGGRNTPPASHHERGLQAAADVPPESGPLVVASLGMSNTAQEWAAFRVLARDFTDARLVDTACADCTTEKWGNPADPTWDKAAERLSRQGVTEADVRVVWMKVTAGRFHSASADDFDRILAAMRVRWPNVEQVFVSSRIYGGYNPEGEPAAYDSGPAVRTFVLRHLNQSHPWIDWGPYLWANGTTARADGLRWERIDLEADGIHPSEAGEEKVAQILLEFFRTSPYASWFE